MKIDKLADDFFDAVRAYVAKSTQRLEDRIATLEARPAANDGAPGKDGRDGIDGKSVTVDDVQPIIEEYLKSIPTPADGTPGKDGAPGRDGRDGVDGKSLALEDVRAHIDAELALWQPTFERRAHDLLQRAIDRMEKPRDGRDGRDGVDGKDGRDGLGVEDFDVTLDGRDLTVTITRGDFTKSRTLRIPALLDAGVFREGEMYERGDVVSFGGSGWIAQTDRPEGKPGTSSDWRLAIKKGRDGKDWSKSE